MQAHKNPFVTGDGVTPPKLAGRDGVLRDVTISYQRALEGIPPRSFMFIGLRGVGKTVLLNKIAQDAEDEAKCVVSMIEAQEGRPLTELLFPLLGTTLRKLSKAELAKDIVAKGFRALRNFAQTFKISFRGVEISIETAPEPGVADSGNLEFDLPDMFELIGKAALKQSKVWILLIDEVQCLTKDELGALIVTMHKMSQRGLPVVLIGAGLPQVAKLAGETKSYAERLFDWRRIGPLSHDAINQAIRIPVEQRGVTIETEALDKIAEITRGYPFFIQALAFYSWQEAQPPAITLADIRKAYRTAVESMIDGIVRFNRLTATEVEYVKAMSQLPSAPYRVGDVAAIFGRSASSCSRIRDNLIKKGTVYSTQLGYIDFTIPLFAKYLNGTLLEAKV